MGSSGIRRRKVKRSLPPVSDDASAWPTDDETPPIMWSEPGSGFEASGFSPAGAAPRQWWFLRRIQGLSDREIEARAGWAFRSALPLMGAFAAVAVAAGFLSLVLPMTLAFPLVIAAGVALLLKVR